MIVVTACTTGSCGGGYERFLPRWMASVQSHLPHASVLVCNLGEISQWRKAAHMKPVSISRALVLADLDEQVLWIDIDAEVVRPPVLFDSLDAEIAFRQAGEHSMTGTCWMRATAGVRLFVSEWAAQSAESREERNQLVFERLLPMYPLKVAHLPAGYCFVGYDKRDADVREEDRVVVHWMHAKQQRKVGRK